MTTTTTEPASTTPSLKGWQQAMLNELESGDKTPRLLLVNPVDPLETMGKTWFCEFLTNQPSLAGRVLRFPHNATPDIINMTFKGERDIFLLDDPDFTRSRAMWQAIRNLCRYGITMVLSTRTTLPEYVADEAAKVEHSTYID